MGPKCLRIHLRCVCVCASSEKHSNDSNVSNAAKVRIYDLLAIQELKVSYYNKETLLCTIDLHTGIL